MITDDKSAIYIDTLRAYVMRITPTYAQKLLDTMNYERQRRIKENHVEYLTQAIRVGELTDLVLSVAEFPNGRRVLVDGYHRLKALVAQGQALLGVVIIYRVENEDELNTRYAKLDRNISRSPADMLRAYGVEQESGIPSYFLQAANAAIVLIDGKFARAPRTFESTSLISRTNATKTWVNEIKLWTVCLKGATTEMIKMMKRAPVLAVALVTLRYQPETAAGFWTRVAQEDKLPKESPEAGLLRYTRANPVNKMGGSHIYARTVANAWNAAFEGRTLVVLKTQDATLPININGTPFKTRWSGTQPSKLRLQEERRKKAQAKESVTDLLVEQIQMENPNDDNEAAILGYYEDEMTQVTMFD